jgi:hypothetical protein
MQQFHPNLNKRILKSLIIWINSNGIVKITKVSAPTMHPRAVLKGRARRNKTKSSQKLPVPPSFHIVQGKHNPMRIGMIR